MCDTGEISLERKELPFIRCEEVFLFWKSSHTKCGWSLSLTKRTFFSFTRCEEVFLFWQSSHTKCGWSLLNKEDFLSPGVRKSFYSGRVPHQMWRGLSINKRIPAHLVKEKSF